MAKRKQEVQAIETEYGGVLFRSRLEARWAMFFDLIGIKWKFEPEGFRLGRSRYVPDFQTIGLFLSRQVAFFEVKRDTLPLAESERAIDKCLALSKATGLPVFIGWGYPGGVVQGFDDPNIEELILCRFVQIKDGRVVLGRITPTTPPDKGIGRALQSAIVRVERHRFWEPKR